MIFVLQTFACPSKWCLLQNVIFINSWKSLYNAFQWYSLRGLATSVIHPLCLSFYSHPHWHPTWIYFILLLLNDIIAFCVVQPLQTMGPTLECGQHSKGNVEENCHSFSQKLSAANSTSASGISYSPSLSWWVLVWFEFSHDCACCVNCYEFKCLMAWLCEENSFYL